MGFWKSVTKVATDIALASAPREEKVQEPLQIMIVKEPQRTKRRQFQDMINDGRDTDGVLKTRRNLDSVSDGSMFKTDTSDVFGRSSSPRYFSVGRQKTSRRENRNPWDLRI